MLVDIVESAFCLMSDYSAVVAISSSGQRLHFVLSGTLNHRLESKYFFSFNCKHASLSAYIHLIQRPEFVVNGHTKYDSMLTAFLHENSE